MPTTPNPDLLAALDPGVLAELAHMQRNGRPGFMQRVIELYLRTAAELIGELETASVKNEPAMLFRASHTLKPCSATVGAISLAALCEALEGMARSGFVPDATACVARIKAEYRRVEAALTSSTIPVD